MVILGIIGFAIGMVAALFMFIGLIPFLGWLNWFTTLPLSIIGAIVSGIGFLGKRNWATKAGLALSLVVLVIAIVRLAIGGGFF